MTRACKAEGNSHVGHGVIEDGSLASLPRRSSVRETGVASRQVATGTATGNPRQRGAVKKKLQSRKHNISTTAAFPTP